MLSGTKRATAELLEIDYRVEAEDLSHVGECLVVVDSAEAEVTAVDIVPFYEVTWEFADAEGEGFHSIQHWRKNHLGYWASAGEQVDQDTESVCMSFRLLVPVALSYSSPP